MRFKSRPYRGWFGRGDAAGDAEAAIELHGEPQKVLFQRGGYMVALVYQDKVVVVGYDGDECCHTFIMNEIDEEPK